MLNNTELEKCTFCPLTCLQLRVMWHAEHKPRLGSCCKSHGQRGESLQLAALMSFHLCSGAHGTHQRLAMEYSPPMTARGRGCSAWHSWPLVLQHSWQGGDRGNLQPYYRVTPPDQKLSKGRPGKFVINPYLNRRPSRKLMVH